MKSRTVSKMTLSHQVGASVILFALAASYAIHAHAEDRFSGLGVDRQKVEKPKGGEVEHRLERRIEQPKAEAPRERQVERRHERREERRDEWRDERRADRHFDRRVERIERHQERRVYRQPVWRGDIRYFDRDDYPRWRGGAWRYARHEGRLGWWWVLEGGSWYYYSQPVYPYPDPYIPSGYYYSQPEYSYPEPYVPPVIIMQSDPVESTPDIVVTPAPASQSWYYCESSAGYYPYIASCPEGWKSVPATSVPVQ